MSSRANYYKRKEQAELKRRTDEFLAKGGSITKHDPSESGIDAKQDALRRKAIKR